METTSPEGLQGLLGAVGIEFPETAFSPTDIYGNPMGIWSSHLADSLVQLTECDPVAAHRSIQWASDMSHLIVVAAGLRIKDIRPEDLAADLQRRFPPSPLFGHPVDDGKNILFYFSDTNLARVLIPYIIDRGPEYGKDLSASHGSAEESPSEHRKVVVEFSSPNLGREFNGLHFRSTVIGAFISSLHERMGWDVCRMNFLGDWGRHIGLLAAGWSRFGSEEEFETDPLRHLIEVYAKIDELFKSEQQAASHAPVEQEDEAGVEVHGIEAEKDEFFKKMEDGDPAALELWKRFRDICIAKYTQLYARLNITFDDYSGESSVQQETIEEVEEALKESGVYKVIDDAWKIEFSKPGEKGHGQVIARFRNGTTSYLLRDIASVVERHKTYSFDKMIYVVSGKQVSHFQQVFKAIELMGYSELAGKLVHVPFGVVQGLAPKDGTSGLLLGDILDQCQEATGLLLAAEPAISELSQGEVTPEVTDHLAGLNLMVEDLSIRRTGVFTFDLNKLATPGDYTGLSLQKWFTRLSSKLKGVDIDREGLELTDYSIFEDETNGYADVLRLLIQFPGTVKSAYEHLESANLLTLLFSIMNLLPSVWEEEAEAEASHQNPAKLAFYKCVHHVLENGMRILGLVPLEMGD